MNKNIILLIKILLTVGILTYIFIKIPLASIFSAIGSANIFWIVIAVLLTIPVTLLSAYQTKYLTLIQKMVISYKQILKVYLTTSFYSLFLPGPLVGGGVKWYKFTKYGSKSSAAVVVVYNRYLETFIVILIGIVCSIPTIMLSSYKFLLPLWIITLLLLFILYIIPLNQRMLLRIEKVFNKIPLPLLIKQKTESLFIAGHNFQNFTLKDHVEIIAIMLLYHFINIISYYILTLALGISIDLFVLGWVRSVVLIVTMIPFSISGFGVREGILIYLLNFYGIPPNEAVALSFLSFFKNLSAPLVGGFLELKDFILTGNHNKTKDAKK